MSLIPGIAGQKTELFDGAKIDAITEYTSGNGVQIQGRTNGSSIPAGYIGETITATCSAITATTTLNVDVDVTGMSIVVPVGIWLLYYNVAVELYNASGGTTALRGRVRVTDGSNNAVANTEAACQFDNAPNAADITNTAARITVVRPTATTTYKVRVANGTGTAGTSVSVVGSSLWGGLTDPDNQSVISAIRIA